MRPLAKPEQAAIDAVARHFSAAREEGRGACLSIGGKRIAIEVATVRKPIAGGADLARPRLRFDKVALGLVGRLQAALHDSVPDGNTVIVTITAPIRLPSKTAATLEDRIRSCLARRSASVAFKDTIHGNQFQVRLVRSGSRRASKVVGLVHNPDSDPDALLHLTQALLQHVGAAAGSSAPGGDRWLVVVDEGGLSHIETYRQVYAQLCIPTGFRKILMVLPGRRVEVLTE